MSGVPVAAHEHDTIDVLGQDPGQTRSYTILVIEEEYESRRSVRDNLDETNTAFDVASVESVEDVGTALTQLGDRPIDAIILDLATPRRDDLRRIARLRAQTPNTPIVVIADTDDRELATGAMDVGAHEYLRRDPLDGHMLARILCHVIERQQILDAFRAIRSNFEAISTRVADAVLIVDRNGMVRFANPAAETLFAPSTNGLRGRPFGVPIAGESSTLVNVVGANGDVAVAEMRVQKTQWRGEPAYLAALRNVTEQVRANRALEESEQRYRSLFDHHPDAVYAFDREGRFISANKAVEELSGYSEDELKTMTFVPMVAPEYREKAVAHFQKAAQGAPQNYESVGLTRDGERVHVNVTNLPIVVDGEIVGVFGIAKDITKRKQVEETQRRLTRELSERVKELNCLYNISKLVGQQNASLDELFQMVVDTIPFGWQNPERTHARITVEDRSFVTAGFTETIFQQASDIVADGEHIGCVEVFYDGVNRRQTDTPFLTEEHSLLDDIALRLGDAIERRRAEQALRDSEERYRLLAENATDVISRHDLDGTILYASPACGSLLGYTPDELVGRRASTLLHPEDVQKTLHAHIVAFENDTVATATYRVRHQDGSYVWFETTSRFLRDPTTGNVRELVAVSRDITERHQRERELEAIASVAGALRAASSPEEMPPIILDQLSRLLNVDGAALALYDERGELVVEMAYGETGMREGELVPETDALARVIRTGQPYVDDLYQDDSRVVDSAATVHMRGAACVPLTVHEHTLGSVWIGRKTVITDDEVRVLNAVVDIAANAINRAMLHEETKSRMERLAALRRIDAAIATTTDLAVTLDVLLEQTVRQLDVDAAAVLLLDANTRTLKYGAGYGFRNEHVTTSVLRVGQGYAGRAVQKRTVVEAVGDELHANFARRELLEAEDFAMYVAAPLIAKGDVHGVLEVYRRMPADPTREWLDFFEALAGQAAIALEGAKMLRNLKRSNAELVRAYDETIEGWALALDLRDEETEGHTRRVTRMTVELGHTIGLDDEELVHVRRGALLHDIGKMGIPDSILLKPGPLDDDEWEIMRQHPVYSYELLSRIDFLQPALDIPYCHHEKWDGSGYPRGLQGKQIPLAARLFAVVDVYDALTSDRPYREAWPEEKALQYIREQAGRHFDPAVVTAFLQHMVVD